MQRRSIVGCAALFVIAFLATETALAQGTLGRLVGTVLDSSGGVLPGATATLSNDATGGRLVQVTNAQGGFSFSQLPVGTYKLAVELAGFKTARYNEVVINVGQEYSLTAKLEIGALTETVGAAAARSPMSPAIRAVD